MIFDLDKAQKQIQKAVSDFVKGEFKKEVVQDLLARRSFPEAIWRKACDLGFVGIHFPEEYAGQGLGALENILIAEALSKGDASVGMALSFAPAGAEIILKSGSDEQKAIWLPKISEGDALACAAVAEPGFAASSQECRTTAVKEGDAWVIDGVKTFAVNAGPLAGFYLVLCRTDANADKPGRGLSVILVEPDRDGVSVSDVGHKLGGCLMAVGELRLDGVRVPPGNLIGREGKGDRLLTGHRCESQMVAAAVSLGIAQGAYDRSLEHARQRVQFGKRLVEFQVTRHKLAEMAIRIESARLMTYRAACQTDGGGADERICAMAKLQAARMAVDVCDEAIQLFGGYGYIQEYDVERYFREAKTVEMLFGSRKAPLETLSNALLKRRAA
jgi:alkylation response protein AidB-like acyl-CoA dehydrogenase